MTKLFLGFEIHPRFHLLIVYFISVTVIHVHSQSSSNDADVMQALKRNLSPLDSLDISDPDTRNWEQVRCSRDNRITRIQLGNQNLKGFLPETLNRLTKLQVLEFQNNQLTGPIPSLAGLTQLQNLLLSRNNFTSIPSDLFNNMSYLQHVYLDYNGFASWYIPFSALTTLHLSFNLLEGGLPDSFSGSSIQSLWLNGQNSRSKLNGTLDVQVQDDWGII